MITEQNIIQKDFELCSNLGEGIFSCGKNNGEISIKLIKNNYWVLWMYDMDCHYRLKYGPPIAIDIYKDKYTVYTITHCSTWYDNDKNSCLEKINFIRNKLTDVLIEKIKG
jgi:hypothetical protein